MALKLCGIPMENERYIQRTGPQKVAECLQKIKDIRLETIAHIDETWIDSYIYRERAWSKRGIKISGKISGKKYKRTGLPQRCTDASLQSRCSMKARSTENYSKSG